MSHKSVFNEATSDTACRNELGNLCLFESEISQKFDQHGYFEQTAVDVHLKLTTKPIIKKTSNTLMKKATDIRNAFSSMTQSRNLDQLRFKIQFEDLTGATRTAHYDANDREISLSKRHKFPSSLRQAVSDVASLNTDLCDNIFRKIEF